MEKRLRKITSASVSESRKKDALRQLRTKNYRDLPVYKRIQAAYEELS